MARRNQQQHWCGPMSVVAFFVVSFLIVAIPPMMGPVGPPSMAGLMVIPAVLAVVFYVLHKLSPST